MSTPKKEKIPDSSCGNNDLWKTFVGTCGGVTVPFGGMQFSMDITGATTAGYTRTTEEILTDIWHNQATMIKWHTQEVEALKEIIKILKKITKTDSCCLSD